MIERFNCAANGGMIGRLQPQRVRRGLEEVSSTSFSSAVISGRDPKLDPAHRSSIASGATLETIQDVTPEGSSWMDNCLFTAKLHQVATSVFWSKAMRQT